MKKYRIELQCCPKCGASIFQLHHAITERNGKIDRSLKELVSE